MRKKWLLSLIFAFVLSSCELFNLSDCSFFHVSESSQTYDIDQTYFFGMGDVLVYEDHDREDIDKRIAKMKELGVKSHRLWLRLGGAPENPYKLLNIENNKLVINKFFYDETKYAISELVKNGITHITATASWYYGKEDGQYVYYGGNFPLPGSRYYEEYLEAIYETFYILAENFPELEYIEMGNEFNGNFLAFNNSSRYPVEVKTTMILDLSYYASKGIIAANPNCKPVLNGVLDIEYARKEEGSETLVEVHGVNTLETFFDVLYSDIESGNYPTISDVKSTNPDDYFKVIAYHPYSFKTIDEWIKYNNRVYKVIEKHGDGGKPVFITEWGIEKFDSSGGDTYLKILENKDKTPYIAAIHYYIFSDAVDYSGYCMIFKNNEGEYEYTKSGQALYDKLVKK